MTDNNKDGVDELVIDRSHIRCDYCGKPGPTKNCSRCLSCYYCNRQCQLNHWRKNHKQHCAFLKDYHDSYKMKKRMGQEYLEEKEKGNSEEPEECAICLEEIELPISLECGHVFCVQCLMQYQAVNNGKGSCPNCRGDHVGADQIGSKTAGQMAVYVERAKRSDGVEREVYVNLALQQIEAAYCLSSFEDHLDPKDRLLIDTIVAKTTVLGELNMHREVIDTVDKFMNICDTADDIEPDDVMDARLARARAYLNLEEWQTALDMLRPLYEDCKKENQRYCSVILTKISRAHYELSNYHEAIIEGNNAVKGSRFRVGVHKYIALSHMKLGDITKAKKSITQGILHEGQWDEENRKENEEVLRMILAEEAKKNKPKGKKKGKKKSRGR